MRAKVWVVFFMLVFLLSNRMIGQSSFQAVSYIDTDLYAESFQTDEYGHKIISSLALTNAKGLKWVYVKFTGRVLIQTDTSSDGHLFAYSKLIDYKISGEDHFRDFEIDSLLLPTSISGQLQFKDNGNTIAEMPVEILLSGGVIDLETIDLPFDSLKKLLVRIEVDRISYAREKYDNYINTTRLINTYYSYSEILTYLVKRYGGSGIGSNLSLAQLLIGWHELSRIRENIDRYPIVEDLHLDEDDPLGYLNVLAKFERLEKRVNTILNKKLAAKPVISISEKSNYCKGYTNISIRYSELSKKHQPYISSGFLDIVKIQTKVREFEVIDDASKIYDVFNKLDLPSTPQTIYNLFVELAENAYDESDLVLTLDLLYNASVISSKFSAIVISDNYANIYEKTLDGLLSSYLQVAIMAYRAENFDMADSYYNKAQDIYRLNLENEKNGKISSSSFLKFINQQIDLAYEFMNDEKFREGLKMVSAAQSMSKKQELDKDAKSMDSVFQIGYLGVYQEKLDSVGDLIENVKIDKARTALEIASNFSSENKNYINGDNAQQLRAYANDLYRLYFERGERLMKSKQPEDALINFIEAQTINNTYLHESRPELDTLIYSATIPVILDLIKKAEFEVWANRVEKANHLRDDAIALQIKYKQETNPELVAAFEILDEKITNRKCVNLSNACFTLQKKVENRIRNKNYFEANSLILQALEKIREIPDCEINDSVFIAIQEKYTSAIEFAVLLVDAEESIKKGENARGVREYSRLAKVYDEDDIKRYGIPKPDLKALVEEEQSPALVMACVDYYVEETDYPTALEYLKFASKMNYSAKDFRPLQETVGSGLAKADKNRTSDKNTRVDNYTQEDKWFKYFRSAYLKSS